MRPTFSTRNDTGIAVRLNGPGHDDPSQVFWSKNGNSYIVVIDHKGELKSGNHRCKLYSVNGIGEIRWSVGPSDIAAGQRSPDTTWGEMTKAAEYFGLESADIQ